MQKEWRERKIRIHNLQMSGDVTGLWNTLAGFLCQAEARKLTCKKENYIKTTKLKKNIELTKNTVHFLQLFTCHNLSEKELTFRVLNF